MPEYWAVLSDETGCEFGRGVVAPNKDLARDQLREDYPESRVVQLESAEDAAERELRTYRRAMADYEEDCCYDD